MVSIVTKLFYPKLAFENLKKNKQIYIPYLITCVFTAMMFYMLAAISQSDVVRSVRGAEYFMFLLYLGWFVVGLFSIIFIMYTNSFLMKRRKKEFGLLNILGLEKKHLGLIITLEIIYTYVISLVLGLILGVAFYKLLEMSLMNLIRVEVVMGLYISFKGIQATVILFTIIFALVWITSIWQIIRVNPIELLQASKSGEKEPKVKVFLLIIGVLSLGAGYFIAQTIKDPISALVLFFVAVILVVIGTYCLFVTGTTAVLKVLKNNKSFYYKPKNFTAVSGMLYRMKQNAVGLANICILATMVLVMISATASLYLGIDKTVSGYFTTDVNAILTDATEDRVAQFDAMIEEFSQIYEIDKTSIQNFRYEASYLKIVGDTLNNGHDNNYVVVYYVDLSDYNRFMKTNYELKDNEVLMHDSTGKYKYDHLTFGDDRYEIVGEIDQLVGDSANISTGTYTLICNDIKKLGSYDGVDNTTSYSVLFNFADDSIDQAQASYELDRMLLAEPEVYGMISSRDDMRDSLYNLNGGFLFIGLFLGTLFTLATALIIYYKQVSEGYDDKERFDIMQKVGMSHQEVKSTINRQIIMVFFLPLIVAVIHIAFAFKMISLMLLLIGVGDTAFFMTCTVVSVCVFSLIYIVVYLLTSKTYYRIVKRA